MGHLKKIYLGIPQNSPYITADGLIYHETCNLFAVWINC